MRRFVRRLGCILLVSASAYGSLHAAARPVATTEPVRSVIIVFLNGTGYPLSLAQTLVPHGKWTPGWRPPQSIDVGATAQWRSESNGVFVGTEGVTVYRVVGTAATIRLHWDNPFKGKNTYDAAATNGFVAAQTAGGEGNRTYAQFYAGLPGKTPTCNVNWVMSQLRTTPNREIKELDKFSAMFTTPFKTAGFSGWVTTGCTGVGTGVLVRDAPRSSDLFITADVLLSNLTISDAIAPLADDEPSFDDTVKRLLNTIGDRYHAQNQYLRLEIHGNVQPLVHYGVVTPYHLPVPW